MMHDGMGDWNLMFALGHWPWYIGLIAIVVFIVWLLAGFRKDK